MIVPSGKFSHGDINRQEKRIYPESPDSLMSNEASNDDGPAKLRDKAIPAWQKQEESRDERGSFLMRRLAPQSVRSGGLANQTSSILPNFSTPTLLPTQSATATTNVLEPAVAALNLTSNSFRLGAVSDNSIAPSEPALAVTVPLSIITQPSSAGGSVAANSTRNILTLTATGSQPRLAISVSPVMSIPYSSVAITTSFPASVQLPSLPQDTTSSSVVLTPSKDLILIPPEPVSVPPVATTSLQVSSTSSPVAAPPIAELVPLPPSPSSTNIPSVVIPTTSTSIPAPTITGSLGQIPGLAGLLADQVQASASAAAAQQAAQPPGSNASALSIAIGVTVGAAAVLLTIAFILIRYNKAQKRKKAEGKD